MIFLLCVEQRLRADGAAALDELVGPEAIGLLRIQGQLAAARAILNGSDAVPPVIAADEVASGPAENGHTQSPGGVQHVAPKPRWSLHGEPSSKMPP
jgi:hypothetical protein